MTNSTELIDLPDQPDGIEDDSRDLPDPLRAARRVGEYIAANGDGMYDRIGNVPLYARDLEALRRATESAEQVQAERDQARIQVECLTADTDDRDSEISSLRQDLDFQTKAAFDNQAELDRQQAVVDAAEQVIAAGQLSMDTPGVDVETIQHSAFNRLAKALEALNGEGTVQPLTAEPDSNVTVVYDRVGAAWSRDENGSWRMRGEGVPWRFHNLAREFGPITMRPAR